MYNPVPRSAQLIHGRLHQHVHERVGGNRDGENRVSLGGVPALVGLSARIDDEAASCLPAPTPTIAHKRHYVNSRFVP